jgi:hypothetical protein
MAKPKAMNIRRIFLDPPPPISLPKSPKTNIFSTLFRRLKQKLQAKDKGERVVMEVNMDMDEEDYPDTEEDSFRTVIDE